jgi:AcrB/AcrD/AcrF family
VVRQVNVIFLKTPGVEHTSPVTGFDVTTSTVSPNAATIFFSLPSLPLAIVLVVPMWLLASATGLDFRGMPIDILAQIGFVVLVGLAAKNAILIVEFARQRQDQDGDQPEEAATAAARIRLRPILMTSFAFILISPLALRTLSRAMSSGVCRNDSSPLARTWKVRPR